MYKIADDLLIIGQGDTDEEADQDHDRNLKNLLDRCRTKGIKLNKDKFQFKCSEVSFIGHVMTKDGLKPDSRKVAAIVKMECPADVPAVEIHWASEVPVKVPARPMCEPLHRLLLRLQQYDYKISYKPGKDMLLADTLSRAYLTEYERSATEVEVEHIHATHFLPVREHQLKELQKETACDQTLQMLKEVIVHGFPDTKLELPAASHPYFQLCDKLSVHDGIIFKGLRCVIPQTLRPRIKAKLHKSHIGVQGCLRRA